MSTKLSDCACTRKTNDNRANDSENNVLLDYLRSKDKKVNIHYIRERITFNECFEFANALYLVRIIIITNADMYFNETLGLLNNYDFTNKFLNLTRWNVDANGNAELQKWPGNRPAVGSFDTWIFRAPIKSFKDKTIQIGSPFCDGRLAYEAWYSGLTVLNPCLSIQTFHVHLSGIRHYAGATTDGVLVYGIPQGQLMDVPWCTID